MNFMKERAFVRLSGAYLYENEESAEILDEVLPGWAVSVENRCGKRSLVTTHYGYSGWVNNRNLYRCSQKDLMERDDLGNSRILLPAFTDLMDAPRVSGHIIASLSRGSIVEIIPSAAAEGGYLTVQTAEGLKGFVPEISLADRKDDDSFLYQSADADFFLHQPVPYGASNERNFRSEVVKNASRYLGTQYRWGGKSSAGIDCSGLAFMSYMMSGILIWRDSKPAPKWPVKKIPLDQLEKGDLIYFPGHVAISMGNGKFIHSTGYKRSFGCVINSLLPEGRDFREDLREKIICCGSIFKDK
jgi:gamma-D-glutamyl-L-lysine dipeptidyl-peptidase